MTLIGLDEIATYAIEILEKKSLCQQDPDTDVDNVDIDADSSEYEAALVSNASDVFGAMASVLGPDFGQAFGQVLPLISKYSVCLILCMRSETKLTKAGIPAYKL